MDNKNQVYAIAKYVRVSQFKVRRVAKLLKGMSSVKANAVLKSLPQKGATLLNKVVKSAFANAVNNHGYNLDDLVIVALNIDEGPRLVRFKPQARGRMYKILKRTCHIKVTVGKGGK